MIGCPLCLAICGYLLILKSKSERQLYIPGLVNSDHSGSWHSEKYSTMYQYLRVFFFGGGNGFLVIE